LSKLKREVEIVQRALSRDQQGYDRDGYNSDGVDRYGRSRELMERAHREEQAAFDSLSSEDQALILNAREIQRKYEQKALEWEKQPLNIKQMSPFYEEYIYHSDITKHSFLFGVFATEEETKLLIDAARLLIRARNKLFPGPGGIH